MTVPVAEVMAGAGEPDATVLTIDELAAGAGIPSRTIRHYQSEKVLPPPQKRGRVAVYGRDHVERLRLIAQLQDRGLSLKAIRDALQQVEAGRLSLEEWLGIGEQLRRPWSEDAPVLLAEQDLERRLDGRRPGLLAGLLDAGVLRQTQGLPPTYLVPSPGLLQIALSLHEAGVDLEISAAAAALLQKHLRRAADDLVVHFLKHAGDGFGHTPAEVGRVLDALPPLSADAVRLIFAREVERALTARAAEVAPSLGKHARRGGDDA